MEAVFPAAASALARGRRARTPGQRARRRTLPVTFAEIKEVDEGSDDEGRTAPAAPAADRERRRPDVLDEQMARFADFRRRRTRPGLLSERNEDPSAPADAPAHAAATADTATPAADAAAPSKLDCAPHLSDT